MDEAMVKAVVKSVLETMALENKNLRIVPIEASGRHVHLSQVDVEQLFGKGYRLTPARDLSQPGQFLCQERVTLIGPKGVFKNVAILGPERSATQAEMTRTDAIALGIDAPIRESGKIEKSAPFYISVDQNMIKIEIGGIVAKRHIHMTPKTAQEYGLSDQQIVAVKVFSDRPVLFEDVVIRVHEQFSLNMHIDLDEANACGFYKGVKGQILTSFGEACIHENPLSKSKQRFQGHKVQEKIITESLAKQFYARGYTSLLVLKSTIVTPLAQDYLREKHICVVTPSSKDGGR